MTREQAKEFLDCIDAARAGRKLQYKTGNKWFSWRDDANELQEVLINTHTDYPYRIKPTPKLRPWKPEEVPVGALMKLNSWTRLILGVYEGGILMHHPESPRG